MPSAKDIADQQERLLQYRSNVQLFLRQIAVHGGWVYTPPGIINSLAENRTAIARCKAALRGWGVAVEDHPDDREDITSSTSLTSTSQPATETPQFTPQAALPLGEHVAHFAPRPSPITESVQQSGQPDSAPMQDPLNNLRTQPCDQSTETLRFSAPTGSALSEASLTKEVRTALAQISDPKQLLAIRLAAGDTLGRLGDPRLLDPRTGDAPIGGYWCLIEPGLLWFGHDHQEALKRVSIPYFYKISRFLVTNTEYEHFVYANGYTKRSFWSEKGWMWLSSMNLPSLLLPRRWNDNNFNQRSQPVISVSWHEAFAYCSWLTTEGHSNGWLPRNTVIRLPTWREWQRAARHTDGRSYPWGDEQPDPERSNYKATNIGNTTPVGCFPAGRSVCGAFDLAGNVWEWTSTPWTQPYQANPLEEADNNIWPIVVGGSFPSSAEHLYCGARFKFSPYNGSGYRGFRIVLSISEY